MKNLIKYSFHLAIMATIVWKSAGCGPFEGATFFDLTPEYINSLWDSAALTQPYDTNLYTVYTDERLKIQHGASCVSADRDYYAAQVVSALYGDSVDVWQHPTDFDIYPVPPLGQSTGIHEVLSE